MRITIEGARWTPRWETLEQALREMLIQIDGDKKPRGGRLVRIAKLDASNDYRSPGIYELNFEYTRFLTREVELITLEVK